MKIKLTKDQVKGTTLKEGIEIELSEVMVIDFDTATRAYTKIKKAMKDVEHLVDGKLLSRKYIRNLENLLNDLDDIMNDL